MLIRDWCDSEIPACIITGDTSGERLAAISECGLPLLHKPLSAEALQQCLYDLVPSFALDSVALDSIGQASGLQKQVKQIDEGERYYGAQRDLHAKDPMFHIG